MNAYVFVLFWDLKKKSESLFGTTHDYLNADAQIMPFFSDTKFTHCKCMSGPLSKLVSFNKTIPKQ